MAVILLVILLAPPLKADTIVLKNGRRIVAEAVVESGDKVTYEGEYGSVTIPRNQVERIERGGPLPPRRSAAPFTTSAVAPAPARNTAELPLILWLPTGNEAAILQNGAVNERLLADLSREAWNGDIQRQNALNAHMLAASYEVRQKRTAAARAFAEQALQFAGQDRNALLLAAQIDLLSRNYSEAREHLLVAQANHPESPDILALLGYAAYYAESAERAVFFWKQAQALKPDPRFQALMDRMGAEVALEAQQRIAESYHFLLSWEGSRQSEQFGREVLETLEQQYRELEISLHFTPREPVAVILYSASQFRNITRAPDWAGALNDGKIRVPVQGLTSMTADLAQVLKHELTHSFIFQFVQGRCPQWLNEGVAQAEAGESSAEYARPLTRAYAATRQIPMAALEGGFSRYSASVAALAYGQSVAAVEMIREHHGDYQISELLEALRDGHSMEDALRSVLRLSYQDFEDELAAYVKKRYPL